MHPIPQWSDEFTAAFMVGNPMFKSCIPFLSLQWLPQVCWGSAAVCGWMQAMSLLPWTGWDLTKTCQEIHRHGGYQRRVSSAESHDSMQYRYYDLLSTLVFWRFIYRLTMQLSLKIK